MEANHETFPPLAITEGVGDFYSGCVGPNCRADRDGSAVGAYSTFVVHRYSAHVASVFRSKRGVDCQRKNGRPAMDKDRSLRESDGPWEDHGHCADGRYDPVHGERSAMRGEKVIKVWERLQFRPACGTPGSGVCLSRLGCRLFSLDFRGLCLILYINHKTHGEAHG